MDIYSNWDEDNKVLEKAFLDRFEPRIWSRASAQFIAEQSPQVRYRTKSGEVIEPDADEVAELIGDFGETRRYMLRLFRYLSSETMMLFLLGGQKNFPMVRVSSELKANELNDMFSEIAQKKVPHKVRWWDQNGDFSFERWLALKITGRFDQQVDDTLIDFVADEAALLKDRDMINALKHGRAFSCGGSPSVSMDLENSGEFLEVFPSTPGIGAHLLKKREEDGVKYISPCIGYESVDASEDAQRIFVTSRVLKCIADVRRQILEGKKEVKFQVPCEIPKSGPSVRLEHSSVILC